MALRNLYGLPGMVAHTYNNNTQRDMENIAVTFTTPWIHIPRGQPELHGDALPQNHTGIEEK